MKFRTLNKTIKEIEVNSLFDINESLFLEKIRDIFEEYRFPYCTGIYNKKLLETDANLFGSLYKKDTVFWYESVSGGVKIYCINNNILLSKDDKKVELYKRILNMFNKLN